MKPESAKTRATNERRKAERGLLGLVLFGAVFVSMGTRVATGQELP
jgi:hypothetical protein